MIRYGRSETKVFPYPDTVYLRAHTQDNVVVCSHNMIKKHNFFVAGGVPREAKNLGVELTAFRSRSSRRSCSDRTSILKKANLLNEVSTLFLFYKNHVYKNVEAQICLKFKNIVVFLLVAISIYFSVSDEI